VLRGVTHWQGSFATAACTSCSAGKYCTGGLCQGTGLRMHRLRLRVSQGIAHANAVECAPLSCVVSAACPAGKYTTAAGQASCLSMHARMTHYRKKRLDEFAGLTRINCERCRAMPYIDCPAGQTSNAGATSCFSTPNKSDFCHCSNWDSPLHCLRMCTRVGHRLCCWHFVDGWWRRVQPYACANTRGVSHCFAQEEAYTRTYNF